MNEVVQSIKQRPSEKHEVLAHAKAGNDASCESEQPAVPRSSQATERCQSSILVVEDSLPERARVVAILERLGFSTLEASNGAQAIDILSSYHIDLVITDWHMPMMNGLELCQYIAKTKKAKPYIILLTGRSTNCDLISGMDGGADDYLVKPFDQEVLRVRVQSGLRLVQMQQQLLEKNHQLKQSLQRENKLNRAIQKDLQAAEQLQRSTLPASNHSINGIYCAHYFKAAAGVAGDTFSVLPLGTKHIAFYQVDVVGHGIRSAMLSYAVTRFLSEHAKKPPSSTKSLQMQNPAKVLQALNVQFACNENCDDYFTMVYGVLNTETGEGLIAQAGHPHPVIIDSLSRVKQLKDSGIPIGLFKDSQYNNYRFTLSWGSRLFVFSDGLYECRLNNGRALSEVTIEQLFKGLSSAPFDKIQNRINQLFKKLLDGKDPSDDISLLTLERRPNI